VVGTLAAHAVGRAINRAVLSAEEMYGFKSARSFMKK
jgi:L-aminopeptidase/D-esterase-like protein